jgi:hypothetical protein
MLKKHGEKIGNTLRVYHYAQKAWGRNRKHPSGIPLCPKSMGKKEETPCRYTIMPKKRGQEIGNTLRVYHYAQKNVGKKEERKNYENWTGI